jgi:nitrite reductase/ring-hydroxylating ferredoxin subunit
LSLPVRICGSSELSERGDGVRFEVDVGGRSEPAFAVRFGGEVRAYLNRCAHLSYELDFQPGKFFDGEGLSIICSAHGATFDPVTGRCIGGPCYRAALTRVSVEERDGAIYLSPPNIDDKENGHG